MLLQLCTFPHCGINKRLVFFSLKCKMITQVFHLDKCDTSPRLPSRPWLWNRWKVLKIHFSGKLKPPLFRKITTMTFFQENKSCHATASPNRQIKSWNGIYAESWKVFLVQPVGNTWTMTRSVKSKWWQRKRHCVLTGVWPCQPCHVIFFHQVTDVEIKQGRAKWHAPATRSCAGQQTSVQWRPPHECWAGARSVGRGCRCSLWLQPSGANLANTQQKHLYAK